MSLINVPFVICLYKTMEERLVGEMKASHAMQDKICGFPGRSNGFIKASIAAVRAETTVARNRMAERLSE